MRGEGFYLFGQTRREYEDQPVKREAGNTKWTCLGGEDWKGPVSQKTRERRQTQKSTVPFSVAVVFDSLHGRFEDSDVVVSKAGEETGYGVAQGKPCLRLQREDVQNLLRTTR